MDNLNELKVAVLATDGFEESELTVPVKALRDAGAKVHLISPKGGNVQGFQHDMKSIQVTSDRILEDVLPGEYDAVILPGGVINSDTLRLDERARQFVRGINDAGKPIAVICHGGWLLVSAGLVNDRKMTSWPSIADDIRNAGGKWEDREVLVDGNWISSRKPSDLPAFCNEMLKLFSRIGVTRRNVAA